MIWWESEEKEKDIRLTLGYLLGAQGPSVLGTEGIRLGAELSP